jgi:hypothetical protein
VGKKYYVVDTSGNQYSKKPLPKARAERQMKALHINTGHGLCGGNKWDYVRLIAEDIKKVEKRNKKAANAGATARPFPQQIGRHFGRIYTPTLEPLPNVQEELFKLVQDGIIDPRDVQYYQSKIDEYLSTSLYQQPMFKVPDPIYKIRQPEVLLGRPGTQESGESALLNLPIGNDHVARREAVEQAVAQRYIAGLPTRAQVQQSEQQSEQQQQQARQSLAQQQGEIERSQDPRELQRGYGKYRYRYSEPDKHILIGDLLEGSGSGKWTALINALARMYNIPKVLVDSAIASNDRKTGQYRFSAKKQNILSQFSDYLNPTIVSEISELDESDPKSVIDYANTINGRREMALNLRTVNTVNPLRQVSGATSNPLSGRGKRKFRGGLSTALFNQIVAELHEQIIKDETKPETWLQHFKNMYAKILENLDNVQKEKLPQIEAIIGQLMKQTEKSMGEGFKEFAKKETFDLFIILLGLSGADQREAQAQAQAVEAFVEPEEENVQAQAQPQESDRTSHAPQQSRTGQGKLKFIKKYLRGQGLPATKKNVAKICNIMDVEGVVFE